MIVKNGGKIKMRIFKSHPLLKLLNSGAGGECLNGVLAGVGDFPDAIMMGTEEFAGLGEV